MRPFSHFYLSLMLVLSATVSAQTSPNYEKAEAILVQTDRGVLWYSSGGDFLLLKSLVIDAFANPTLTENESSLRGYSIRVLGDELDKYLHIAESTISDGAITYVLESSIFQRFNERIVDRLSHEGSTIRNKNLADFSHDRVLDKARRNPPNKALQQTLDAVALFAGAKSTYASSAAELWR